MIMDAKTIEGCKIKATDGVIGEVHDLLFDDLHWKVRYLVVNTGTWLDRQQVLLSPESVTEVDWFERRVAVALARQQVKDSPDVSSRIPLSREQEEWLRNYYAWPAYWATANLGNAFDVPLAPAAPPVVPVLPTGLFGEDDQGRPLPAPETKPRRDPHLRSVREIRGYHIDATDGEIGHVEDLWLDDEQWTIQRIVVDTKNWWPSRRVVVFPDQIGHVLWRDRKVSVHLTREELKNAPEVASEPPDDGLESMDAHEPRDPGERNRR